MLCSPCRSKFNFCSTVSVNKFDAVIELELRFFFSHFMLNIPRMPSIGTLSLFRARDYRLRWLSVFIDFLFDSLSESFSLLFHTLENAFWSSDMAQETKGKYCGQMRWCLRESINRSIEVQCTEYVRPWTTDVNVGQLDDLHWDRHKLLRPLTCAAQLIVQLILIKSNCGSFRWFLLSFHFGGKCRKDVEDIFPIKTLKASQRYGP